MVINYFNEFCYNDFILLFRCIIMVKVKKLGILLKPSKLPFEAQAVLNPGCWQEGKFVHLFYRAVNKNNESSIGYAKLEGPLKVVVRKKKPIINRDFDYEKKGVEDPRIVKLGDTFYLFYAAYDGKNALGAYATSKDLLKFKKRGLVTPKISYDEAEDMFRESKLKDKYFFFESYYKDKVAKDVLLWEKDIFLFPEKIKGKFVLVHRILPDIQIIYFRDFKELTLAFWKEYLRHLSDYVILENKYWYESRNIGGGCSPIKTKKGWLLIYHGVEESNKRKRYHAGAALLDLKNPRKLIGRLRDPLFSPENEWEKKGKVANVVFPTGTAIFDDQLYIYYGAADKRIAVASVDLPSLLKELTR